MANDVLDPSVGIGLTTIADWSGQHPFLDRFKTARDWVPNGDGVWDTGIAVPEDANGWPTSVPAGVTGLITIVAVDPVSEWASGRYVVHYEGKGTLNYVLGTEKVPGSSVAGRDIVTVNSGGADYQPLFLSISATDAADPIRNIRIVREDQLDEYRAGEIFNPEFLAKNQDWRELRYMDWQATNATSPAEWAERPTMASANWAEAGVPVEVMVELANRTGTDPWFCMPHEASDDYIRKFAAYVRDHLDPRLVAHVEYSNEVWNWIFAQSHYADGQAQKRWAIDANGNGAIDPSEKIGSGWVEFAGMRAAQNAKIWTDVFGAEADARLDRVVATQTGWTGLEENILNSPHWVAEGNAAPHTFFDSYAITGYFDGALYEAASIATVLQWAGEGAAGMAKAFRQLEFGGLLPAADAITMAKLAQLYAYHAAVADRYGLELTMYESGAHLVSSGFDDATNATLTDFFARLQKDPRMGALFEKNMAAFEAAGGEVFNSFVDVSGPGKWGFWGSLENIYQDGSARWDALMDHNAGTPGGTEPRDPFAFANGKFMQGTAAGETMRGTAGGDSIAGAGGNDIIIAGRGTDRASGGAGDDRIFADAEGANDIYGGGAGANDVLDLAYAKGATVTAFSAIGAGGASGGGLGKDQFSGIERIYGGNFADVVKGSAGNETLLGRNGNDAVAGGAGDDVVNGGAGADRLTGGDGADRLFGGGGNDAIAGGAGHDAIIGGAGADRMAGGLGNDQFRFDLPDFSAGIRDTVVDFHQAAGDKDRIYLDGAASAYAIIDDGGGNALITHLATGGTVLILAFAKADLADQLVFF